MWMKLYVSFVSRPWRPTRWMLDKSLLHAYSKEEIERAEGFLRRRLVVGSMVNKQKHLEEAPGQGYNINVVSKCLAVWPCRGRSWNVIKANCWKGSDKCYHYHKVGWLAERGKHLPERASWRNERRMHQPCRCVATKRFVEFRAGLVTSEGMKQSSWKPCHSKTWIRIVRQTRKQPQLRNRIRQLTLWCLIEDSIYTAVNVCIIK